ncbi:MAG: MerR family transcriptional regulator [Anaerolineae bacterium]|nr:MerR family transcriptional regulator [Anaerolineae bacterium]
MTTTTPNTVSTRTATKTVSAVPAPVAAPAASNEQVLLTIQQVAEATGLSEHTLRYYERVGLIHSIERADNGHRRYTQNDIGWLDFLTKLRSTGMSIQEMQRYSELQRQGDATLRERVEMLKALRDKVERHMEELNANLKIIHFKIDIYSTIINEQAQDQAQDDPCAPRS